MEKFMQRENGDLCAHPIASPKPLNPMLEDMNFSDVFGGPPRRLSIKDVKVKYSFGETESEEETVPARWSSLGEKPVFGEEILPRRQHHEGGDFFDDIFRGDESYNSPRRTDIRDRDSSVFRSNPGSRILSPAWPLPPKADPFGISTPTQFSLPAKLTKGLETPRIASHVQHVMDGSSTNGLTSPHSPSLSRFSSPVSRSQDEYRHSPLSHEVPSISKGSPPSDQKENGENSSFGKIFHFSIYKWAGREVPVLLPLVGRNNIGALDGNKYERSASSNERIESRSSTSPKRQSMLAREEEKISMEYKEVHETSEPKSQSQISANDVAKTKEGSSRSKTKPLLSFLRGKSDAQRRNSDKEVVPKKKESLQSKQKPLHAFLGEQQGVVPEITQSKKKILNGIHRNSHEAMTLKKNEGTRTSSNDGTLDKSDLQPPGVALGENRVRGMVREYVQIFNQEADSRPRVDLERRSRSSRLKADEKESAEMPEASIKVDDDLKKDGAHRCSPAKNGFLSEKPHSDSMTFGENGDDFSDDDFLVQELSEDHEIITESEDPDPNDTKAIDSKIRQWAFGKKGNIRSLLSTLQFVLWPESGWKPVPLVELIESNAVKRAYQKALLRLHPDKLQQKGAVFHQKYIAEKVFDILQEAWDQFNVLVPI